MHLPHSKLQQLQNRIPGIIGEQDIFRCAVCIPLIETPHGYEILLQVRSRKIPDQPGDICLPGGHIEEGESPQEAAIRELCEELLIDASSFSLLGPTDIFHNGNIIIYPFAGILKDYAGSFHEAEVESVFTVPLSYLLETQPDAYTVRSKVLPGEDFPYERINGGKSYNWRGRSSVELFYEYDGHWIWGITARILHAFADMLR